MVLPAWVSNEKRLRGVLGTPAEGKPSYSKREIYVTCSMADAVDKSTDIVKETRVCVDRKVVTNHKLYVSPGWSFLGRALGIGVAVEAAVDQCRRINQRKALPSSTYAICFQISIKYNTCGSAIAQVPKPGG